MKKGIIVLLIAVLISGFAFAGTFNGSAGIEFNVDLDGQAWGFANPKTGKYTFKFEFDSTKVAIGADHQTDVWAELEADASAWVSLSKAGLATNADVQPKYTARITKANIHVGEIVFGILNAGKAVDYAASYYDDDRDGNPDYDVVKGDDRLLPGFTVTYKGWYGGFGAQGLWDDDSSTYEIWAHGKTQSFKFADDQVAVEAGGYAHVGSNTDQYIGGGVKADFTSEKVTAGIAGDGVLKRDDVDFGIEGAIYATYDFLRLDIYGASKEYFWYADDDPFLKLDAKISADYAFTFGDDIELDVTGYVEGRDTLAKYLILIVGATESTTIDRFYFEATEEFSMFALADADMDAFFTLMLDLYAEYNADKFTAWVELVPYFLFDKDDDTKTFGSLEFECGIKSTEIIEFAEVGLTYKNADLVNFEDFKGTVTAYCTIAF